MLRGEDDKEGGEGETKILRKFVGKIMAVVKNYVLCHRRN